MPHYASLTAAVLTAASLSCLLQQQADAATLFTGSSTGSFGNPTVDSQTDPDALFSIENTAPQSETFVLGQADTGSMPNMLTFLGAAFETPADQAFAIGELSYFNGQTFIGTNVSSVPIDIILGLKQPIKARHQFGYRFDFDLTPNVNASNADQLLVSANPAPQTFTVQNNRYRIELLGFSQSNGSTFTRSFEASEDEVINATLFAQLSLASINHDINEPESQSIPEPGLIVGLLSLTGSLSFLRSGLGHPKAS